MSHLYQDKAPLLNKYWNLWKPIYRNFVINCVKKLFTILTVILVLTGMLNISVAKHYCGGKLVASKISLSGTLASCGMVEGNCPYDHDGDQLESHCCDDDVTAYSIDNNYTPVTQTASEFSTAKIAFPDLSYASLFRFPVINYQSGSDISPPGLLMTSSVDLSDIRVLRI
jgi:hypothetical protein